MWSCLAEEIEIRTARRHDQWEYLLKSYWSEQHSRCSICLLGFSQLFLSWLVSTLNWPCVSPFSLLYVLDRDREIKWDIADLCDCALKYIRWGVHEERISYRGQISALSVDNQHQCRKALICPSYQYILPC